MHIKFINHGTGSAKSAEEYLLQEHDHKGEIRADVQVLRGNPSHVTELADSLKFEHRYRSGVIAWHVDDNPSAAQIAQVLDDFERVAFAGLEPNQYSYYAVLHEESNGAKHVHIIVPRVELTTGKSMNISPPNWQKTYDVLVDKYNTKHEWASPKDLHRRKLVNNQVSIHSDMSHTKAKTEINKAVMELVGQGTIKNEDDVIKYLNSINGVTVKARRSKKNLSIELEGIKKPIRLEGLAYAKGFDVRELRQELRAEQEARAGQSTADRNREYERVSEVFENIIEDRAKFNRGRYAGDEKEHHQRRNRSSEEIEQNQDKTLSSAVDNRSIVDTRANIRNISPWELDNKSVSGLADTKSRDSKSKEEQRRNRQLSSDNKDLQQRARIEEEARIMARRQRELDSTIRESERAVNDTVRARVKGNIESARRAVLSRAKEHNEDLRKEYERSVGSHRTSKQHDNEAEPNITKVREHINELANQYRQRTNQKYGELIQSAKSRVRELTTSVKYFREKAVEKVQEISMKAKRAYSQTFGNGMSM